MEHDLLPCISIMLLKLDVHLIHRQEEKDSPTTGAIRLYLYRLHKYTIMSMPEEMYYKFEMEVAYRLQRLIYSAVKTRSY